MDKKAYVLAKKYTDETAIQFGGLKGANTKIRSIEHENGQSIVTFEWKNDDDEIRTSVMRVNDGTPIYVYEAGTLYKYGDLVIYASQWYRCVVEHVAGAELDPSKFAEIGSTDGNYDIIENSSELPARFTPADRKMYYSIEDAAFWLWNGYEWELQSAGALTDLLKATKTVGGVNNGMQFESGTPLETVIRQILNPVEGPTLTPPSATITTSDAKVYEKGSTVSVTLKVNLNRGSISPAYGTSGYRSGPATGYSINGGVVQTGNTFVRTVDESNASYTGTANYSQGEQPKDSHGDNYGSPLPAGSVTSAVLTFEFVNAMWANQSSSSVIAKLPVVSKSAKTYTFNFPACSTDNPETFDVPSAWTITAVEVKNELTGGWDDATGEFRTSDTTHSDAGGTTTAYTRYTCSLPYAMDARQIRIKWS